MADYNVGTVELQVKSAADSAIQSLDRLSERLHEITNQIEKLSPVFSGLNKTVNNINKSNLSGFNKSLNNANKSMKKVADNAEKTQKNISQVFSVAKIGAYVAIGRRIGNMFAGMFSKSVDFIETANLFQVSMKDMYYEALRFNTEMSRALGLNQEQLMRYQAVFNNMLTALPGLTREVSYNLSELLTKSAVDYAALFNVSIENSMNAWKAMLSGQVRPIRNASGFDVTETTIFDAYQRIYEQDGIMPPKTMRQLDQIEKRLLRILTTYEQMYSTDAIANYALTIEQPAQQLKVLVTQLEEIGRWFGTIFLDVIAEALPVINGVLITFKEVLKSIAYFGTGWKLEIIRSDDPLGGLTEDLEKSNEQIDQLQKKLFSFDKFESLQSSKGGLGGGIDPKILEAITKAQAEYNNQMSAISMKANEISESMLKWLGYIPVEELDGAGEKTGAIVWQLKEGITPLGVIRDSVKAIGIMLLYMGLAKLPALITKITAALTSAGGAIGLVGKALKGIALYLLIENVLKLINGWEEMDFWAKALSISIAAVSAAVLFLNKSSIVGLIMYWHSTVLPAIQGAIAWLGSLSAATWATVGAVALLVLQVGNLVMNWDKMSGIERVVGVLGAVAAAATIAAIAIAGLQSAWTLGIGAVAIVAGIASMVMAIKRANSEAQTQASTMQNIPGYATGGYPVKGQAFMANEREVELIGHEGSSPVVANNNQIFDGIEAGVYKAVTSAMGGGGGSAVTFDFKNVDDNALARLLQLVLRNQEKGGR